MNWDDFGRSMLALVIWREARGEGYAGMVAVAYSILNRVERPSWWGKDLAGVIGKKWQYSSLSAPGDPQLIRFPRGADDERFNLAMQIASHVLNRVAPNPVLGADSYYDVSIPPPNWAQTARFVAQIGRLRFYDVDRDFEAT